MKDRVVIKSSKSGMVVNLDPDCPFSELERAVAEKFEKSARFWGNIQIALILQGRTLSAGEEMKIVNAITEHSGVEVLCLLDQDAQRMQRCEKALNEKLMELSSQTGQFYRGDLNRGESLESEASVVIIGDVRHGARVSAKGNVIVLGQLRGTVYAGASGDEKAVIAAMEMAPLQLKIGEISCHYGDRGRKIGRGPMLAFVENCSICTKAIKKSGLSLLNLK